MSAERKLTPGEILKHEHLCTDQEAILKDFDVQIKKRIARLQQSPASFDTFEGKYAAYQQGARSFQLDVLSQVLHYLIANHLYDQGFNVDTFNSLEDTLINIREGVPLEESVVFEASRNGTSEANEDFFDLLSTHRDTPQGRQPLPLHRWTREIAERRIEIFETTGNGQSLALLPTKIPGVEVIYNYAPGERIPTREVIVTDISVRDDIDDF